MLFNLYTDYGFCHEVAMKYSIHAAMVLNRIAWSINYHAENGDKWRDKYFIDGQWWMDNTYEAIANHFRGLISPRTIQRIILEFENDAVLIPKKIDNGSWNQTKWYAIDAKKYAAMTKKSMILHDDKKARSMTTKRHDRSRRIGTIDDDKKAPSSYSNSLTNNQAFSTTRERTENGGFPALSLSSTQTQIEIYPKNHIYASVFQNLAKIAKYRQKFNLGEQEEFLVDIMSEFSLNKFQLETLSFQWQEYHNGTNKQPSSPNASFRSWVKNEWRNKNEQGRKPKFEPSKIDYDSLPDCPWLK